MLNSIFIMVAVLLISTLIFLLLAEKDSQDQENDIDTYVCNKCFDNECTCEKEAET